MACRRAIKLSMPVCCSMVLASQRVPSVSSRRYVVNTNVPPSPRATFSSALFMFSGMPHFVAQSSNVPSMFSALYSAFIRSY